MIKSIALKFDFKKLESTIEAQAIRKLHMPFFTILETPAVRNQVH